MSLTYKELIERDAEIEKKISEINNSEDFHNEADNDLLLKMAYDEMKRNCSVSNAFGPRFIVLTYQNLEDQVPVTQKTMFEIAENSVNKFYDKCKKYL